MGKFELSKLFPSLERELIEEMENVGEVKEIQSGQTMVRTGQNIRSAILVLEGLVKIYRENEDGSEYFMYYIDAGKACAISLVCSLGSETSGVMARAVSNATIVSIPLQYVDEWLGKYKSWAQFTIASYRQRYEELLQTIDHIAFRNMDERLVYYLQKHQQNTNSNVIGNSITEIAHELNSSREVISRLLKKLSEKNVVRLGKSGIEIINLQKALS